MLKKNQMPQKEAQDIVDRGTGRLVVIGAGNNEVRQLDGRSIPNLLKQIKPPDKLGLFHNGRVFEIIPNNRDQYHQPGERLFFEPHVGRRT
jgi:hypothetical protein